MGNGSACGSRKIEFCFSILAILLSFTIQSDAADSCKNLADPSSHGINTLLNRVGLLELKRGDTIIDKCTATYLGNDNEEKLPPGQISPAILTSFHCLAGISTIEKNKVDSISFNLAGENYKVLPERWAGNREFDYAVLKIKPGAYNKLPAKPMELFKRLPSNTDTYFIYHAPEGNAVRIDAVKFLPADVHNRSRLLTFKPTDKNCESVLKRGSSGGPIFSKDGVLVAINEELERDNINRGPSAVSMLVTGRNLRKVVLNKDGAAVKYPTELKTGILPHTITWGNFSQDYMPANEQYPTSLLESNDKVINRVLFIDDNRIAAGNADGLLALISVNRDFPKFVHKIQSCSINFIAKSHDNKMLAVVCANGLVVLYDIEEKGLKERGKIRNISYAHGYSVSFDHTGKYLLVGYGTQKEKEVKKPKIYNAMASTIVWNIEDKSDKSILDLGQLPGGYVCGITSSDHFYIVASCGKDSTGAQLTNLSVLLYGNTRPSTTFSLNGGWARDIRLSSDNRYLLVPFSSGKIFVYDVTDVGIDMNSSHEISSDNINYDGNAGDQFTKDNTRSACFLGNNNIIGAYSDQTIRGWSYNADHEVKALWTGYVGALPKSIDCSSDGKMLVTGDYGGKILLWKMNPPSGAIQ